MKTGLAMVAVACLSLSTRSTDATESSGSGRESMILSAGGDGGAQAILTGDDIRPSPSSASKETPDVTNASSSPSQQWTPRDRNSTVADQVDPLDGDGMPPSTLIEPTDAMRSFVPPRNIDPTLIGRRAIPTNNWWGNLIAHDKTAAIQPVWSNPYALQFVTDSAPFGLAVSYPFRNRVVGGASGNSNASRYYAHGLNREIVFSAAEFAREAPNVQVVDWADLGVAVEVRSHEGSGVMATSLVSGMAYVTAKYSGGLTPEIASTAAISSVNGQTTTKGSNSVTGSQFDIVYNNGQRWILYALNDRGQADQSVTFDLVDGSTLRAKAPFVGILRAALVVEDGWVTTLDKHRSCIVLGGTVTIGSDTSYAFEWKTTGGCQQGLLHYAMKHHQESFDGSSVRPVDGMVAHSSTRGAFQAVVTATGRPEWRFHDSTPVADGILPSRPISREVASGQHILEHLKRDIAELWSLPLGGSYYFNGKAAQKYASLCLLASIPVIVGDGDRALLRSCLTKLRSVMTPFLGNTWSNRLQYDRLYGGIVSSEGFKKNDLGADFGNTMYNDHHFHYGYWLYATAMINELDPTWSALPRLNNMAKLLARDVANFGDDDRIFPRFRSFDWFRGHSYSHGVTPFADGKDQESTSEDINFSFGLYLLGKTTHDERMTTVGRLMTRVNAHAIRSYFLIEDDSAVHPSSFRPNKVTGIFFDNKVDYATWFSSEKHCIHGIQMIPVSPITEFVRSKRFVQQEWDEVLAKTPIVASGDTSNAWLSLLYTNYAQVDKAQAMRVLQTTKMDDGLSRAWALFMAASMA
ncbi:hypothetical protein PINS_up011835 [Pythium insidiosum]|nr:hypothetical protein PINS_up011835 [Pythium insidiosum]